MIQDYVFNCFQERFVHEALVRSMPPAPCMVTSGMPFFPGLHMPLYAPLPGAMPPMMPLPMGTPSLMPQMPPQELSPPMKKEPELTGGEGNYVQQLQSKGE